MMIVPILVAALLAAVLLHRETLRRQTQALENINLQLAEQVDRSHGVLLGAMIVQGLIDPQIKAVLSSKIEPEPGSPLYQGFSAVIRHFKLDNMQIVDARGVTVAYVDDEGSHHGIGTFRNARPFVARTLAGLTSRDPMIGRSSGVRGIYLAAPVRADVSAQSAVLGSVVVRTGLEDVDRVLREHADPVMLLSPDGLVYSTNRDDWMLKFAEPLPPGREEALRESQQFGKLLATGRPDTLPFRFSAGSARLGDTEYLLSERPLNWDKEGRGWRLLLLRERSATAEWIPALGLAAGILIAGTSGTLLWLRRKLWRLAEEQARLARDAELRAVTEASHARLLRMSESLPCAVFQFLHPPGAPNDARFLFVGHPAREVLGLSADALVGDWRQHLEQIHPLDRRRVMRAFLKARRKHAPLSIDYRAIKNDQTCWLRMSARMADEAQGDVWTGYWLDVSEEIAHHEDLQLREQQLLHLLESAPSAVIVSTEDGKLLFNNRHAQQMYDLRTKEVLSLYVFQATRSALIETLRRDGFVQSDAVQMRRGDGSTFWAHITLSRGTFGNHRNAIFGWAEDITERRQAAETMRRAKEAAEEAAAARSTFLANMSHEIRTPMNAILGLAHLALDSGLTAPQRAYVEKIHHSAQGLLGIINDILDFSKIEAGKLVMEHADFELDELLDHVATLTCERAASKGLEVVFDVDEDVPLHLHADALRLGQVLTNLISNAIKFTEHGEVVLACSVAHPQPDGITLDITVSDTGIGMSAEQAERVFAPFCQADASTTRRFGGTGLGLSICKRLVEAAGGDLTLKSAQGRGSSFRFTWPCRHASMQHPAPALPAAYQGARALVVVEHERAAAALSRVLHRLGCDVDLAGDVQQAEHLLEPDRYRLLMCDHDLPEMAGLDLIRRVSSIRQPTLTCMLVTSRTTEDVRGIAQLPDCAVLLKPVTQSGLLKALAGNTSHATSASLPDMPPALQGLRVLLVEDNEINQMVAVGLMDAAGVIVDVSDNGRLALERLAANPGAYDVILMDMQMPEMDGYETTRRLRASPEWAALPVIAMTAHAMTDDRQRCFDAGVNDYLSKPIDPLLLYRTLARWGARTGDPAHPFASVPAPVADFGLDEQVGARALQLAAAVPGLDATEALRRLRGNWRLYTEMLQRYVIDQADFPSRYLSMLERGDIDGARRTAHTFKGLSATIGLAELAGLTAPLETKGRDQPDLEARIEALRTALASALDALRTQLASEPEQPAAPAQGSQVALQQLLSLLDDMDGEAVDHARQLEDWLARQMNDAERKQFKRHLLNFDFDKAASLLRSAIT